MNKTAKIISNIIYSIGVTFLVLLGGIALFGSHQPVNPNSMLQINWREQAFIGLAFGMIPMLFACMAVYKFNNIKGKEHKKKKIALVFLPGFICAGCALFCIGVMILGYINMFLR